MELFENIKYYLYYMPKHIYKSIRHWVNVNARNPWHWKMVWFALFHHYPWDYEYMQELLYYQIQKSRWYFVHVCDYISDEDKAYIVKYQTLAIRMLDIILEHDKLYDFVDIEGADESLPFYQRIRHVCLVNVNMKNKDRFAVRCINPITLKESYSTEHYEEYPEELYKEKAKHILNKILENRSEMWCD